MCVKKTVWFVHRNYPGSSYNPGSCLLPFFALLFAHFFRRGPIARYKIVAERRVGACNDALAQPPGQPLHKTYIVNSAQPEIELLLRSRQVMHVGSSIILARVTIATLLYRIMLRAEARCFDVDAPSGGEQSTVAGHARRQHAVKHIHAQPNANNKVLRRSHAQQVTWLLSRQGRGYLL